MKKNIVLATGNAGKVAELSNLLSDFGFNVSAQTELGVTDADETGLTFIENAIIKARHAALSTGLAAIADDSGLAVNFLGGAPGIYSARYAGLPTDSAKNIEKLLFALKDVPQEQRQAQFHCVLVYLRHAEDPTPIICQGIWKGEIALTPSGSEGFGYDPVFYDVSLGCTAAQLSKQEKMAISHRGKALKQLLAQLTHDNH